MLKIKRDINQHYFKLFDIHSYSVGNRVSETQLRVIQSYS